MSLRIRGNFDVVISGDGGGGEDGGPGIDFHFSNQELVTYMPPNNTHDLMTDGGPLIVRVAPSRRGKKVPRGELRVLNVRFEPEGIAGAELTDEAGTTIEFRPLGETGETVVTIEAEYRARPDAEPKALEATLTLNAIEAGPDGLDLEITPQDEGDGGEGPPPGPGPGPEPEPGPGPGPVIPPPGPGPGPLPPPPPPPPPPPSPAGRPAGRGPQRPGR